MSETTFEREVLDRLTKIEAKLDSFDAAKKKTYDNENEIIPLDGQDTCGGHYYIRCRNRVCLNTHGRRNLRKER